jgi:hypothetical protein
MSFEFYYVGGQLYARRKDDRYSTSFVWFVSWGSGHIRASRKRHWVPDDIQ